MAEQTSGLAHYRQRKSLSQRELGELLSIPQEYISRMESGTQIPTAEQLDKICNALEVTPNLIFSRHILAEIAERARA